MSNIPRKVEDRIQKSVLKFKKVLKIAKDRDVNEADTVSIVNDMLGEIFGYDKYIEVTSELLIRGTYCDLAIKIDESFYFIIECKAIGIDLKESHLKQAIDYGANKGIQWVILTNGMKWHVYKIRFEQPINYDLVFSLDFEAFDAKNDREVEILYALSKEGLEKNVREELYNKTQNINKFIIGNMILTDSIINSIRKELRKFADTIKIDTDEIVEIIKKDVIKREIIDSDEATCAQEKLKRHFRKVERQQKVKDRPVNGANKEPTHEDDHAQPSDSSEESVASFSE